MVAGLCLEVYGFARDLILAGLIERLLRSDELLEGGFVEDGDTEFFGFVEFGAGVGAYYHVGSLFAH